MGIRRHVISPKVLAFILPLFASSSWAMTPNFGDMGGSSPDASDSSPVDCERLDGGDCDTGCDTGDCIDDSPNHECESGDEDCVDSSLDLFLEPCGDKTHTCEEDEDDEDETSSTDPVRLSFEMTQASIDKQIPILVQRGDEEVARVGGYLADANHDNIFGFRLGDFVNPLVVYTALYASGKVPGVKGRGVEVEIVVYRESVKSMVADVLGVLVQKYPYKRRRCGLIDNVGEGLRWRLGQKIKVEQGIIWNRHISPMVEGTLTGILDDIEEQIMTIAEKAGVEDYTTVIVTIKNCGTAPDGGWGFGSSSNTSSNANASAPPSP